MTIKGVSDCECLELKCKDLERNSYCDGACGCHECKMVYIDGIEMAEMSELYRSEHD